MYARGVRRGVDGDTWDPVGKRTVSLPLLLAGFAQMGRYILARFHCRSDVGRCT